MPGRTRGETCAVQKSHLSMDLMSMFEHTRLANQLANREAIEETVRELGCPRIQVYFPTAIARDLSAS